MKQLASLYGPQVNARTSEVPILGSVGIQTLDNEPPCQLYIYYYIFLIITKCLHDTKKMGPTLETLHLRTLNIIFSKPYKFRNVL